MTLAQRVRILVLRPPKVLTDIAQVECRSSQDANNMNSDQAFFRRGESLSRHSPFGLPSVMVRPRKATLQAISVSGSLAKLRTGRVERPSEVAKPLALESGGNKREIPLDNK